MRWSRTGGDVAGAFAAAPMSCAGATHCRGWWPLRSSHAELWWNMIPAAIG